MTNMDVIKGKWKQLRDQSRVWWGKLSEDDLDHIDGSRSRLIGKLQERYGYTKDQAAQEVNERLKDLESMPLPSEKTGRKKADR